MVVHDRGVNAEGKKDGRIVHDLIDGGQVIIIVTAPTVHYKSTQQRNRVILRLAIYYYSYYSNIQIYLHLQSSLENGSVVVVRNTFGNLSNSHSLYVAPSLLCDHKHLLAQQESMKFLFLSKQTCTTQYPSVFCSYQLVDGGVKGNFNTATKYK
jgi:hypothetical protein